METVTCCKRLVVFPAPAQPNKIVNSRCRMANIYCTKHCRGDCSTCISVLPCAAMVALQLQHGSRLCKEGISYPKQCCLS